MTKYIRNYTAKPFKLPGKFRIPKVNFLAAQYIYMITFYMHVDQFCAECVGSSKALEHVQSPCVPEELVKILNTSSNRAKS